MLQGGSLVLTGAMFLELGERMENVREVPTVTRCLSSKELPREKSGMFLVTKWLLPSLPLAHL